MIHSLLMTHSSCNGCGNGFKRVRGDVFTGTDCVQWETLSGAFESDSTVLLGCDIVCGSVDVVCGSVDVLCGSADVVCGSVDAVCGSVGVVCGSVDVVCGSVDVVCGSVDAVLGRGDDSCDNISWCVGANNGCDGVRYGGVCGNDSAVWDGGGVVLVGSGTVLDEGTV